MFKVCYKNLDDKYGKLVREVEHLQDCLNLPGWENTKADKDRYLFHLVMAKRKLRKYVDSIEW